MNTYPRCRREGGREGGREEGREGGREGGRKGGREGGNQREQNNKAKRAKAYGNAS